MCHVLGKVSCTPIALHIQCLCRCYNGNQDKQQKQEVKQHSILQIVKGLYSTWMLVGQQSQLAVFVQALSWTPGLACLLIEASESALGCNAKHVLEHSPASSFIPLHNSHMKCEWMEVPSTCSTVMGEDFNL